MSRIGNQIIEIPEGVTVNLDSSTVTANGPLGQLYFKLPKFIKIEIQDNIITVKRQNEQKQAKANHGLTRAMINNLVIGVSKGFSKKLIFNGVGYRAQVLPAGDLELQVGFSHPVIIKPFEGVSITVNKNEIDINGIDKQRVGELAAQIRKVRPPEPYKGKGIRYSDEIIRRKAGKTVKTTS